jgi:hypothetical protein
MVFSDVPFPQRRMTPDEVLAVFQDQYRWLSKESCSTSGAVINNDTTIADWRAECDLLPWKRLGRGLNTLFQIRLSDKQWKAVLVPARSRTLQGVCELIASEARVPEMRAVTVLGRACRPAGVFLALREGLRLSGIDVTKLRPSTPLAPMLRRHFTEVVSEVMKVAPGALPPLRWKWTLADKVFAWIVFWPFVVALAAGIAGSIGLWCLPDGWRVAAAYTAFVGWTVCLIELIPLLLGSLLLPTSLRLGELHDFRDLCYTMLGEEPKRRSTAG